MKKMCQKGTGYIFIRKLFSFILSRTSYPLSKCFKNKASSKIKFLHNCLLIQRRFALHSKHMRRIIFDQNRLFATFIVPNQKLVKHILIFFHTYFNKNRIIYNTVIIIFSCFLYILLTYIHDELQFFINIWDSYTISQQQKMSLKRWWEISAVTSSDGMGQINQSMLLEICN